MNMKVSIWNELGDDARSALLERPALRVDGAVRDEAARIIALVRDQGDSAILGL